MLFSSPAQVISRHLSIPSRCLLCRAPSQSAFVDLCPECREDLPRNRHHCAYCALPLPTGTDLCGQCIKQRPPWFQAVVPFCYAWPINRLQTRYKFSGRPDIARSLAYLWAQNPPVMRPEAVIPVPLHKKRLKQRGYDQSLELARYIAGSMDLPLVANCLYRVRDTRAQSRLNAASRKHNLKGAFKLHQGHKLPAYVALFDDVMTTGATLTECTRTLLHAGVERIDVWALLRVEKPTASSPHLPDAPSR